MFSSSSSTTVSSEIEFAKQCATFYHAALPLGANLVATDLQPADDLAVLAACALINAHNLTLQNADTPPTTPEETQALLFDIITFLEYASLKSRWCHASRFLLVRLYRLLGASSLAYQNYNMANLKSIQHDTLSHNILSRASIFSLGSAGDLTLINECVESSQVYSVNSIDVSAYYCVLAIED
jgi:N-terminal acetyltransferase B complex non-catalytic subunit